MKIGVISDTHLSIPEYDLKSVNEDIFADVDMIFHAGDLTRMSVLEAFGDKKVYAVCGNMDKPDVINSLPEKRIIDVGRYKFGLIHGYGPAKGIESRIISSFSEDVHVICFGHTHKPANHIKNGILMFNPGAFSGSHLLRKNRSVGVLTIDEEEGVTGTIITI
jgi:hypothetical protein